MKLPKSLKIVGKRFKIIVDPKLEDCGTCDSNKHEIKIKSGMPFDAELDTVIHEITHAIDFQMNLEMSERQVHGVGAGLAAVLTDNPKFIDYMWYLIKEGESNGS